jgi:hypothetical protein
MGKPRTENIELKKGRGQKNRKGLTAEYAEYADENPEAQNPNCKNRRHPPRKLSGQAPGKHKIKLQSAKCANVREF